MERISKSRIKTEVPETQAPKKKPLLSARREKSVVADAFEGTSTSSAGAKLSVKAPPKEIPTVRKEVPSFSEFAQDKTPDATTLREYARTTNLKSVFDAIRSTHSDDLKVKSLQGELKRIWADLEVAQKSGRFEEMALILDNLAPLMNRISESLDKAASPSKENVDKPAPDLRLADRLTADEAADKIKEFNGYFKDPSYEFKDLKGQTFSRAEDQQAVKSKMGGKGIGPFYLNEKGDKMLAPDRDAHGGGTFKYFKKVDNQWVRQQTLDHEGKPFRT